MKPLHAVLILCGAALGVLLACLAPALAQPERAGPPTPAPARYQISAFAGQAQNGDMVHGCYTIDTATGETWVSLGSGGQQRVSEPRTK